jgi:hypothetical protein
VQGELQQHQQTEVTQFLALLHLLVVVLAAMLPILRLSALPVGLVAARHHKAVVALGVQELLVKEIAEARVLIIPLITALEGAVELVQ